MRRDREGEVGKRGKVKKERDREVGRNREVGIRNEKRSVEQMSGKSVTSVIRKYIW